MKSTRLRLAIALTGLALVAVAAIIYWLLFQQPHT